MMSLPLLLAVVSLGCGLDSLVSGLQDEPTSMPTRTPMPTFTPTPAGAAFVDIQVQTEPNGANSAAQQPQSPPPTPVPPTNTPAPPPTEPPPPADTPTPEAAGPSSVTILQDMNVRGGPGTNYPVVGPGPAGESATIIGRNSDNSWVKVEYPLTEDGTGWVYADLVQINGTLDAVEVVQAPPPPAAAPAPAPQVEAPPPPPPAPKYQFTPTGWHASENAAIAQFKGRIKDEGGNLVNGFAVLADNGAFRVLSHPTGASQWYPEKGDGEWDIVMPNIGQAQGWWWLTVVSYECNFAGGFDSQCGNYTRLSEDVKIEIHSPEESIINADWVCHWDCNKGLYVQGYRR